MVLAEARFGNSGSSALEEARRIHDSQRELFARFARDVSANVSADAEDRGDNERRGEGEEQSWLHGSMTQSSNNSTTTPHTRQRVEEMILPTSIRSLIRRRKVWSMERRTRRSSGYDQPNARQRENRDVIYIGGSTRRQRVRLSMRDRNGRPATNCPHRVR